MSAAPKAFVGASIHDGVAMQEAMALVSDSDGLRIAAIEAVPQGCRVETLDGGIILPGFVDLQVNGGGGMMFNDDQSVETVRTIATAHLSTGTQAILPTLITDTYQRTKAAIEAIEAAIDQKVPGIAGLHLEGPHLSVARKGAHDPALIRPMDADDLALALSAADRIANVMVTVAPESASNRQIKEMAQAGITVSLGHTDASAKTCHMAFDAGAKCVTHLFNAMSQLGNREPGLVGALLERDDVHAGLIADAIHVDPAVIRIALAAKPNSDQIFLVTDAMATAGSDAESFRLNGREVFRKDGRLTLEDGTLAGADLEMAQALRVMTGDVGDSIEKSIARATTTPARLLREPGSLGRFDAGRAIYIKDDQSAPVTLDT